MHTSAHVRRRVLPVRDRSAAECHGHQQGQKQQRRTPALSSPPHRAETGSCTPSNLLRIGTAISSTQRRTHDDVTSINMQNTRKKRRADLKKSEAERKECTRAAPGADGAGVVETQHEKCISMPVRSHCSWRGAAQRAPSAPASPHLLERAEKPRSAVTTSVRLLARLIVTPVRGVARLTNCAYLGYYWSCTKPLRSLSSFRAISKLATRHAPHTHKHTRVNYSLKTRRGKKHALITCAGMNNE